MAAVNLIDVSKQVGQTVVLDKINLTINQGEFVVIVGPSGCGKSTLLRLIAGLDELSSGEIRINNQCANTIPAAKRDIAMVFQSYALYPHMTVFNNMAYALKMRGVSKAERAKKVAEAAKLLRLTSYLERKPRSLSGGQRQRVAMGRAIVRSPAIFLFDEPLSNLDAKLRTEMRLEIKKIHQKLKTTSVYVTHDQTEAMTMADRVVVLNQGQVEQIGTPQQLYQNPATLFVAEFTGHYPINLIPAHFNKNMGWIESSLGVTYPLPKDTGLIEDNADFILAIRPEHVQLVSKPTSNTIELRVDFIDDMGADKFIYTKSIKNGMKINIRVSAETDITEGTLFIELPQPKIHAFDQKTGLRIGDSAIKSSTLS